MSLTEIIQSLTAPQMSISSKYFYDERGSKLFEQICNAEEYYLTRTEINILNQNIEAICQELGSRCFIVEPGSGGFKKVRSLFNHLRQPAGYMPIDVSTEHLAQEVRLLESDLPDLPIYPVHGDYTREFELPDSFDSSSNTVIFYPGSSIGNFHPAEAKAILRHLTSHISMRASLLVGFDLKKDKRVLEAAYNDRAGITAAFNRNILTHLNDRFGSNFNPAAFAHRAFYNEEAGRVEMRLHSLADQKIKFNDHEIFVARDAEILTEYSYKYREEEFQEIVPSHLRLHASWVDPKRLFAVHFYKVT